MFVPDWKSGTPIKSKLNRLFNKYFKFVGTALAVPGNLHLQLYSCKLSNRTYSEKIRARKYWNQVKEVKFKLLVHNLDRYVKVFYYSNENFYRIDTKF